MHRIVRQVISEREWEMPTTEFVEIMKLAQKRGFISLGPGEPDFTSPRHVIQFAKKKLDEGYTHYSPLGGRLEVKEAIAEKLRKDNKIKINDPDKQIIITCGAKEALFLSMMCLIDPTEAVLVPNPGYLAYNRIVESVSGVPLPIRLREEDGFEFNPDLVKEILKPKKTRVMIINTPSNPTGTVFSKKILEEIADIAVEYDLTILSDEAYEKFVYDNAKHISIGSLNGMDEYVITIHSFSKTYAMPGFRIGYAAGHEEIIKGMTKLKLCTTLSTPTVSQLAALAALRGSQKCVENMRKEYNKRRKLMLKRIDEIPLIHSLKPKGAFYLFPNITETGMKSSEFVHFLVDKGKILTVPGTEFGKYGEGYVRLSYATAIEQIERAMDKMDKLMRSLK